MPDLTKLNFAFTLGLGVESVLFQIYVLKWKWEVGSGRKLMPTLPPTHTLQTYNKSLQNCVIWVRLTGTDQLDSVSWDVSWVLGCSWRGHFLLHMNGKLVLDVSWSDGSSPCELITWRSLGNPNFHCPKQVKSLEFYVKSSYFKTLAYISEKLCEVKFKQLSHLIILKVLERIFAFLVNYLHT